MTIANTFASKLAVAFVAGAMVLSAFAPSAKAQTTEELQQMINDLLAQVATLQGELGGGATVSASGVCPYTWTRDLSTGTTGADVKMLQMFLNADPDTRVAVSGAGSAGMETDYYGPATAAAVSKMQVKYRADILSPANLVNPTGYFGPSSRGKANALCIATAVEDDTDEDMDEDEDEDEDEGDMTLSGEASLDSFDLEDGESTLEEGDEDVEVATMEVEFTDGDAEISRIDLTVASTGVDSWDVFETISLWVDGDKVAEMDASDEDEYLDEDTGEVRFSGLDIFAEEDESVEIVVAVSVQNGVDDEDLGDFEVRVSAMRYFDADGVATTDDTTGDLGAAVGFGVSFEVQEAGTDEELEISLSSASPDATDIIVDTDTDTNDVTIMVADLEASDNDIELNTIVVRVDTTGASTTDVVDDIRIVIDGEEFDAENLVSTGKGTISSTQSKYVDNDGSDDAVWYVFDIDGDIVIDEDDEVEMEVVVDFNDTDDGTRYANGTQIDARITSVETAAWEAEGADDLSNGQFDGAANGDEHTLVAEGILVPVDGFDSSVTTLGQNDTIGEFTLEFEVTAVEDDFYISGFATSAATTTGIQFSVSGGTATVTAALDSTADEDTSNVYTVREGETETFTLTVTVDPAAAGTYRVGLVEVNYSTATDGVSATLAAYEVTPAADFRTAQKAINN